MLTHAKAKYDTIVSFSLKEWTFCDENYELSYVELSMSLKTTHDQVSGTN